MNAAKRWAFWKKAGWLIALTLIGLLLLTQVRSGVENKVIVQGDGFAQAQGLQAAADIQITLDQVIASGFSSPVQVTHAGDGTGRMFVVEQTGRIKIVKNGAVLPTAFLDASALVICCGERGLLGLAFHPNYASNGLFYINYTRKSDGATVIARYLRSAGNPDLADAGSQQILLTIPQPYTNHNGGQLLFGKDGYLYIGMGDGGSGGDPQNYAQNINSLLGKMLRIDVDHGSPYAIPATNPFVGQDGLDEIWALGLRNPWRFSFDRLTGDLYIGDVGQNLWEEIDFQAYGTPGGVNFGWRCREGAHNYNFTGSCLTAVLTDPIAEYPHTIDGGYSVTGGFVYRGVAYPALLGRYFYADYVTGKIWSLYKTSENPLTWSVPDLELDMSFNISAFGEDEAGELYVANYNQGQIHHLADINGPTPNLSNSSKRVSTPIADASEVVTYTITISNTGGLPNTPAFITDQVPAGLQYRPGTLQASHGTVDDTSNPILTWQGNLSAAPLITVTYQVSVTGAVTGSIVNQAVLQIPPDASIFLAASLTTPRRGLATSAEDFFVPGTQPESGVSELHPAADCDTCHSAPIYDAWRGSMMSQAGRDPVFWAALRVAEIDAPGSGEYCLRCHTPRGWLQGRAAPGDGSALLGEDIHNGVTCAMCHRMVDPLPNPQDESAAIDAQIRSSLANPVPPWLVGSAAAIIDPNDNRRGPFSFAFSLPYHSALRTAFLGQDQDAVTQARMCGTCHNVYNPVFSWDEDRQQFWPNEMGTAAPSFEQDQLFPVETTFDEWLASDFASGGVLAPIFGSYKPGGLVETCQDCHMPRAVGLAADPAFNPVLRDCETSGCLPVHTFVGGNTWVPLLLQNPLWRLNAAGESAYLNATVLQAQAMLKRAASLELSLQDQGTHKTATVRVINHAGHKLPTGYAEGRQMWLQVQAFNEQGDLIYLSGGYDPLSGQLTRDPAIKVYEIKQGITSELAAFLGLPVGESFHFLLNNTVVKDNRIPPQGVTQAEFDRPGLRPVGALYLDGQHWDDTSYILPAETARVLVLLYYQTSSKEYIEFLAHNGGVDGLALGELWQGLKSPPQVMAAAFFPAFPVFLPVVQR
jgi:uncharacterized repeat protein (TIGR01451 family)